MSEAIRYPRMSREAFLDWAEAQEERYEFDGFQPVAMTGGLVNHSRMIRNIIVALSTRLKGSKCEPLGPDAGVATIGDSVRYPDALVTCDRNRGQVKLVTGVVVVFEALSPTSGRTDRIDKLGEYRAVPSIRRYIILERSSVAATLFARTAAGQDWIATPLVAADTIRMPEIGIEVPLAELFDGVDFEAAVPEEK